MDSPHAPTHGGHSFASPFVNGPTSSHPFSDQIYSDFPYSPGPPPASASDPTYPAAPTTTPSDSRPPTSHGEDADGFMENSQFAGMYMLEDLVENGETIDDLSAYDYDTLNNQGPLPLHSEIISMSTSGAAPTLAPATTSLGQNAAALEALIVETFLPPPPSIVPAGLPEVLLSPPPSSGYPPEPAINPYEAHLSIQDKSSFADITSFFHYTSLPKVPVPGLDFIQVPEVITRNDLQGDKYDFQGIDWHLRQTTRASFRARRVAFETSKMEKNQPRVREVRRGYMPTPNTDSFFAFKRNNTIHRAFYPHFQLRNVLAATSRNDIYYAAGHQVLRTDATGSGATIVMDLSKRLGDGAITTLAASNNVLITGAFEGEYAVTDLSSSYGTPCTFGRVSDWAADTKSRIINHLHLFESRTTYSPQAVLCSNDYRLRVLDCVTDTFTHNFLYPAAVNCAATSPDGRMRVVVGDFQETLIINAETGQPFETLNSHTDDVFACAWADDGVHVATAAQDSTIVIWDARYWARPVKVLCSELSIPRVLRFSPVGSGPRVLIAAEADDYINIINAQTFESKQTFDMFGPIAGISMTPDGQSLFVANAERRFGGIMELGRTGWAERTAKARWGENVDRQGLMVDWAYDAMLDDHERVQCGSIERQRRNVDFANLVV